MHSSNPLNVKWPVRILSSSTLLHFNAFPKAGENTSAKIIQLGGLALSLNRKGQTCSRQYLRAESETKCLNTVGRKNSLQKMVHLTSLISKHHGHQPHQPVCIQCRGQTQWEKPCMVHPLLCAQLQRDSMVKHFLQRTLNRLCPEISGPCPWASLSAILVRCIRNPQYRRGALIAILWPTLYPITSFDRPLVGSRVGLNS